MRNSKQRNIILKTLTARPTHPTAEQLYGRVKEDNPSISLGTVYRNLNLLAQSNLIRKIDGLHNTAHFDHNIMDHYHFTCLNCGDVFDIPCDIARDIQTKAEKASGFKITEHEIVLKGFCKKCRVYEDKGE